MNEVCKIYKNNGVKIEKTSIVLNENSYLVELNGNIIGYFNVNQFSDAVSFDYELIEKYRNAGLGNEFFKLVENWVINNFDTKKILLLVRYDNDVSKHIICNNGYFIDYNELETMNMSGEMTMHSPFVKVISSKKKMA